MSILLLSKTTESCRAAQRFLLLHAPTAVVVEGERGDPLPEALTRWSGDCIVSFLSPWIVPAATLQRARVASLNFHPAPPEYPGIGCYNFAIYDRAASYGVTCHHMELRVDTGSIVAVTRFPLFPTDCVFSLRERSMAYLLALYYDILSILLGGGDLPRSAESWARRPYTRHELEQLCRLTPSMPLEEIERRVRATVFPGAPGPFLELAGRRFVLESRS